MKKQVEFSPHSDYALFLFISEKGNLVLDHYDHSESLKEAMGDEWDWFVIVDKADTEKVVLALQAENVIQENEDPDWSLLNSIAARGFRHHKDYEGWLKKQNIPFRTIFYTGWGPEPDV